MDMRSCPGKKEKELINGSIPDHMREVFRDRKAQENFYERKAIGGRLRNLHKEWTDGVYVSGIFI